MIANAPVRAQTAEEQERSDRREVMEQALQTKERFDLYGLHFDSDKATIQPESKSLLDDTAAALKNFPDWCLRIVGHADSTADPQHNLQLSLDRALAIQAALVLSAFNWMFPRQFSQDVAGANQPDNQAALRPGRPAWRRARMSPRRIAGGS